MIDMDEILTCGPHPDELGPGCVYFFFAPTLSRMKIGRTKRSPWGRLDGLSTGSPERLAPIAVIRSDMRLEGFLHRICSEYRVHGEWFQWPDVAEVLTEAFLCYGGETDAMWASDCAVGRALKSCAPTSHGQRQSTGEP